jgi:hypothetical protein
MTIEARIALVEDVRPHGDHMSIVTISGHEVVANRDENGEFRFRVGEAAIYVPENAIIPEEFLKDRGYWDETKGKGLLGGSKGNRVKMQRFMGFESRGLVWKVRESTEPGTYIVDRHCGNPGFESGEASVGDDCAAFFNLSEYVAA